MLVRETGTLHSHSHAHISSYKVHNHAPTHTHTHTYLPLICGVWNGAVAVTFNCFARIYLLLIIDHTFIIIVLHVNWREAKKMNHEKRGNGPTILVKNSYRKKSSHISVALKKRVLGY